MALILSLETSGNFCGVALHQDNVLLSTITVDQSQAHASKLAILIQQIVHKSDRALKELSAIAVSDGPGSYTGLRIGTSVAKGLCYALDIPLIACNPLQSLAYDFLQSNPDVQGILCPMIDARRLEVYCQLFDVSLNPINGIEAKVIDEHSFSELLDRTTMFFFGDGSGKLKPVLKKPNAVFVENILINPTALGILAVEKFKKGRFEDLITYRPFYLKDFVAKKAQPLI